MASIFNFIKNHKLIVIIIGILIFTTLYTALNGVGLWVLQNSGGSGTCVDYGSDSGKKITGAGGSWTTKGTKAYKTAKAIFDFWVKKGMSGAQAAGIVGNIAGGEDTTLDLKARSGDGGGGLYQFTPYTKYLAISDKSWSVESQSNAVLKLEKSTVQNYLQVTKGKSPSFAAAKWEWMYERPGTGPGQTSQPKRESAAEEAYKLFGGSKIKGKNSLLGGAAKGASNAASDGSDSCDDDGDGGAVHGDIAKTAEKYIGWFHYEQSHGEQYIGSVKHPNKNGITDCSGFVWFVLAKAGYKVPANMQWYTKSMADDAKSSHHWLRQISAKNTRAGDIIIANQGSGSGDDGHTAILLEKYHGPSTRIIQEGGTGGSGGVNKGRVGPSFAYLMSGDITFARAIKK